jgi:macrolide-specific efflux system membrane fusion protein
MRNKKFIIFILFLILVGGGFFLRAKLKQSKQGAVVTKELNPTVGSIQKLISTTGTVLPQNRLEVKPPVNGRVESIMVTEGEKVKVGQTLAWMSSTERAALLDAARQDGEKAQNYWKEVYKPILLISPIEGEVIVARTQPGQTVTTTDAVIVLSDQLIVRAQVDETDIGKVTMGQKATVSLDAYSDTKIKATVSHVYYESKTVNNVTIYEVDLACENVPPFFRSGMNATINFTEESKEDAILVPLEAIIKDKEDNYVLLKQGDQKIPVRRLVKLGISDEKNVEIISGVDPSDTLVIKTKKFSLPKSSMGSNPFMPGRQKKQGS